ncbi:MAG: BACON domain-containing protein [Sumerlaeia bacterium]
MRVNHYIIASFIGILPVLSYSQAPFELLEINSNPQIGSSPSFFEPMQNDIVVFFALDGLDSSFDVYGTDGTTGGTIKLKETNVVPDDDFVSFPLGRFGERILFTVSGTNGLEIWSTDGTLQNTVRLAETNIAVGFSAPAGPNQISADPEDFKFTITFEFNQQSGSPLFSKLVFTAGTPQTGVELWSTDGTIQGTGPLADINPGPEGSFPIFSGVFSGLSTTSSSVYFNATTPATGRELYITDTNTVTFLGDLEPGSVGAFDLPENSKEALELAPLGIGFLLNQDPEFTTLPDMFALYTTAHGYEPWATGGTAETTFMVADINPGPDSSLVNTAGVFNFNFGYFTNFTNKRTILIFSADDGSNGVELWRSNGSSGGTFLLKDFNTAPGVSGFGDQVVDINQVNNFGVFPAFTSANGLEPWVTNGNPAGTMLLKDIFPGQGPSLALSGFDFSFSTVPILDSTTLLPSRLLFLARTPTQGVELWTTDGTAANTQIVSDLTPGTGSSFPDFTTFGEIASVEFDSGSKLAFIAETPTTGLELFTTNGQPGNAALLKDINPGSAGAFSDWAEFEFVNFEPNAQQPSNLILFAATQASTGRELWKTDGTTNGTVLVKDINPGNGDGLDLGSDFLDGISSDDRYDSNNRYYFIGRNADGVEPWYTDATTNGTQQLKDVNPGPNGSDPVYASIYGNNNGTLTRSFTQNNRFLFTAITQSSGRELWVSDGTTANTQLTGQIAANESSGFDRSQNFFEVVEAGEEVVFSASDFSIIFGENSEFALNKEPWAYLIGGSTEPVCTYQVSTTTLNATTPSTQFTITTQPGCTWAFTNLPNWITATPTSGTGTQTVTLNFAENTTGAPRNAQFTVAGFQVQASQAAALVPAKDLYLFY